MAVKNVVLPNNPESCEILDERSSKLKEDERDIQVISVVDAWKHYDFLCRNYVMNALTDSLYNVYTYKKTANELWNH